MAKITEQFQIEGGRERRQSYHIINWRGFQELHERERIRIQKKHRQSSTYWCMINLIRVEFEIRGLVRYIWYIVDVFRTCGKCSWRWPERVYRQAGAPAAVQGMFQSWWNIVGLNLSIEPGAQVFHLKLLLDGNIGSDIKCFLMSIGSGRGSFTCSHRSTSATRGRWQTHYGRGPIRGRCQDSRYAILLLPIGLILAQVLSRTLCKRRAILISAQLLAILVGTEVL